MGEAAPHPGSSSSGLLALGSPAIGFGPMSHGHIEDRQQEKLLRAADTHFPPFVGPWVTPLPTFEWRLTPWVRLMVLTSHYKPADCVQWGDHLPCEFGGGHTLRGRCSSRSPICQNPASPPCMHHAPCYGPLGAPGERQCWLAFAKLGACMDGKALGPQHVFVWWGNKIKCLTINLFFKHRCTKEGFLTG